MNDILVDFTCFECGQINELPVIQGLATCPKCKTKNDVWLEGQEEPKRHKLLNEAYYARRSVLL